MVGDIRASAHLQRLLTDRPTETELIAHTRESDALFLTLHLEGDIHTGETPFGADHSTSHCGRRSQEDD